MQRTLNVVRLQLINKNTFIWVPLIVLAASVAVSVLIYAMIPIDTPKYDGGGQAPLWIFFAIGLSAMNFTFPFSQAISITRREFFLGTMLTATLASALMGVLFLIGGGIEKLTNGYGVNGWVFYLPWVWEAGPAGAFVTFFTLAQFFFVVGFASANIYKRWGAVVVTVVSVGIALVLVGLMYLVGRLELWDEVGAAIATLGAAGLALWGLVLVAVMMAISYRVLRRTTP